MMLGVSALTVGQRQIRSWGPPRPAWVPAEEGQMIVHLPLFRLTRPGSVDTA